MASITTTTDILLHHSIPNSTTNLRHLNNLNFHPLKQKPHHSKPLVISSSLNPNPTNFSQNPDFLTDSTKTLTTLFSFTLSFTSKFAQIIKTLISTPTPQQLETINYLQQNVLIAVGPLFFAAVRNTQTGYINTPLTVVAAGMAKWLDIYSGVLMVRVLLSWFPNIPWDRQPLSAIRDLCDPYLNLFRNIIPPVFDTLDVSPLLAFAVLGTLGSILHGSSGIN